MGFMVTGSPLGHHIGLAPRLVKAYTQNFRSPHRSFSSSTRQGRARITGAVDAMRRLAPQTFASAEEFLAHPREVAPGCLTLDVSLPGLSGLELQKRAALECPHIPTIFLTANDDIPTTVEAMKAGAVEFLTKPFRDNELLRAVREALERSRLVLAKKAEKQALQGCYASLSARERQVMALVSCGLINKQVGGKLGISEITVKAHRGQVMQKMHADSFADLVKMAAKLGLAKRREATMVCDHADRAACPGGQLLGSFAFVP